MTQGIYSIKNLERLTGVKAHTIRIWEKRYQVVKPKRTSTNIRYYCDDDLKRLLNISILLKHGFKISKLADLSDQELGEKIINLSTQAEDTDGMIKNLIISMVDLDYMKLDKIISKVIMDIGFEDTIIKVIYPFLERIGILWQAGLINPAQEHFVSNILRQKILVATDSHIVKPKESASRFILFLPENELHELGLLFYSYLVKKSGNKIIYLGQSVPLNDLVEISKFKKPDALITSITTSQDAYNLKEYIKELAESFPKQKIYVTGKAVSDYSGNLPHNIRIIQNVLQFKKELVDHH